MARRRKKASAAESEVIVTDETLDATESSKSETEGSTESLAADFGDETTGTLDGGEDLSPASSDTEGTGPAVEATVEPTVVVAPEVKVEAKPKKTKKKEVFVKAEAKSAGAFSAPKPSGFTPSHEKRVDGKTVQINSAWTS